MLIEKSCLDLKMRPVVEDLYGKLLQLYCYCEVCISKINVVYSRNNITFDPDSMNDVYNGEASDKISNFAYLPGLFSGDKFITNGKIACFTYSQNSFHFKTNQL